MNHGNRSKQAERRNPRPAQIRAVREKAGLSQTAAADLISSNMRTWQDWEAGVASMHPAFWELFRLKVQARAARAELAAARASGDDSRLLKAMEAATAAAVAVVERLSEPSN